MKIARFTEGGRTRLGIVDGDDVIDVGYGRSVAADRSRRRCSPTARSPRVADLARLAPPASPSTAVRARGTDRRSRPTFLAIGLNYADHVAESGMHKPDVPVVFNKQITLRHRSVRARSKCPRSRPTGSTTRASSAS